MRWFIPKHHRGSCQLVTLNTYVVVQLDWSESVYWPQFLLRPFKNIPVDHFHLIFTMTHLVIGESHQRKLFSPGKSNFCSLFFHFYADTVVFALQSSPNLFPSDSNDFFYFISTVYSLKKGFTKSVIYGFPNHRKSSHSNCSWKKHILG